MAVAVVDGIRLLFLYIFFDNDTLAHILSEISFVYLSLYIYLWSNESYFLRFSDLKQNLSILTIKKYLTDDGVKHIFFLLLLISFTYIYQTYNSIDNIFMLLTICLWYVNNLLMAIARSVFAINSIIRIDMISSLIFLTLQVLLCTIYYETGFWYAVFTHQFLLVFIYLFFFINLKKTSGTVNTRSSIPSKSNYALSGLSTVAINNSPSLTASLIRVTTLHLGYSQLLPALEIALFFFQKIFFLLTQVNRIVYPFLHGIDNQNKLPFISFLNINLKIIFFSLAPFFLFSFFLDTILANFNTSYIFIEQLFWPLITLSISIFIYNLLFSGSVYFTSDSNLIFVLLPLFLILPLTATVIAFNSLSILMFIYLLSFSYFSPSILFYLLYRVSIK